MAFYDFATHHYFITFTLTLFSFNCIGRTVAQYGTIDASAVGGYGNAPLLIKLGEISSKGFVCKHRTIEPTVKSEQTVDNMPKIFSKQCDPRSFLNVNHEKCDIRWSYYISAADGSNNFQQDAGTCAVDHNACDVNKVIRVDPRMMTGNNGQMEILLRADDVDSNNNDGNTLDPENPALPQIFEEIGTFKLPLNLTYICSRDALNVEQHATLEAIGCEDPVATLEVYTRCLVPNGVDYNSYVFTSGTPSPPTTPVASGLGGYNAASTTTPAMPYSSPATYPPPVNALAYSSPAYAPSPQSPPASYTYSGSFTNAGTTPTPSAFFTATYPPPALDSAYSSPSYVPYGSSLLSTTTSAPVPVQQQQPFYSYVQQAAQPQLQPQPQLSPQRILIQSANGPVWLPYSLPATYPPPISSSAYSSPTYAGGLSTTTTNAPNSYLASSSSSSPLSGSSSLPTSSTAAPYLLTYPPPVLGSAYSTPSYVAYSTTTPIPLNNSGTSFLVQSPQQQQQPQQPQTVYQPFSPSTANFGSAQPLSPDANNGRRPTYDTSVFNPSNTFQFNNQPQNLPFGGGFSFNNNNNTNFDPVGGYSAAAFPSTTSQPTNLLLQNPANSINNQAPFSFSEATTIQPTNLLLQQPANSGNNINNNQPFLYSNIGGASTTTPYRFPSSFQTSASPSSPFQPGFGRQGRLLSDPNTGRICLCKPGWDYDEQLGYCVDNRPCPLMPNGCFGCVNDVCYNQGFECVGENTLCQPDTNGQNRCQCKPGFYRKSALECVPESQMISPVQCWDRQPGVAALPPIYPCPNNRQQSALFSSGFSPSSTTTLSPLFFNATTQSSFGGLSTTAFTQFPRAITLTTAATNGDDVDCTENDHEDECLSDELHRGSWCYFLSPQRSTWRSAEMRCRLRGAHLVKIITNRQLTWLERRITNATNANALHWIGLHYLQGDFPDLPNGTPNDSGDNIGEWRWALDMKRADNAAAFVGKPSVARNMCITFMGNGQAGEHDCNDRLNFVCMRHGYTSPLLQSYLGEYLDRAQRVGRR